MCSKMVTSCPILLKSQVKNNVSVASDTANQADGVTAIGSKEWEGRTGKHCGLMSLSKGVFL